MSEHVINDLDETIVSNFRNQKFVGEFFSKLDDDNLARQVSAAAREYLNTIKNAILKDNRIDVLIQDVIGYDLKDFHKKLLYAQENPTRVGEHYISMLLAFRGSGKSTTTTVCRTVYEIIRNPNIRILIASNTQLQAEIFLREIKAHFESCDTLINAFGNFVGPKWDNKEIIVAPRTKRFKESTVTCIGVGGPTASRHYDLILCCHPETEVMAECGTTQISELSVGDKVLSHDGEYHNISKIMFRDYCGPMFHFEICKGFSEFAVTPNHPILVKYFDKGFPVTKFVAAQDIKSDYMVLFPRAVCGEEYSALSYVGVECDEKYYYFNIRDIKVKDYEGLVYNLEVEDTHTYCHPLMISHNCDDLVDEENSRTAMQREKLRLWFYKTLLPTLEPGGRLSISGTRWNQVDLYAYIESNTPNLKAVTQKAIQDDGTSPWPEKFSVEHFMALRRTMGIPEFESQYQMSTAAMQGKIFSYDMFQWYDELPDDLLFYQGVDLAISEKNTADYFVIVTIGLDPKTQKKYIMDVFRARLSFTKQTDNIVRKYYLYKPMSIGIEANAYQMSQIQSVREVDPLIRVKPVFTTKDKVTRAMKFSAKVESGEILFSKEHMSLVEEMLKMPDGDHDDQFDALDIAVSTCSVALKKRRLFEPGVI